jgi:hypothetical protein
MLRIGDLNESDHGKWVEYCSATGQRERGRIKSWGTTFVFVVFHCRDQWDDYERFTAAATLPEDLSFVPPGG